MTSHFKLQSRNEIKHHRDAGSAGFSLIELLVVLAIVAILAVLTLPALSSAFNASKLNSASQMVMDSIGQARQEAVAKDRNVQMRFYNLAIGQFQGWCAFQIIRVEQTPNGSTLVPVTRIQLLPPGVIISDANNYAYSPLLRPPVIISGVVDLPIYGTTSYAGFYFLPSGSTSALSNGNNFLTLQMATAVGSPPANYSTIQISPITGKATTYRP